MLVELGNQDLVSLLLSFRISAKDASSSLRQCPLPGTHLAGVNLKPAGDFCRRFFSLQGLKGNPGLECWVMLLPIDW